MFVIAIRVRDRGRSKKERNNANGMSRSKCTHTRGANKKEIGTSCVRYFEYLHCTAYVVIKMKIYDFFSFVWAALSLFMLFDVFCSISEVFRTPFSSSWNDSTIENHTVFQQLYSRDVEYHFYSKLVNKIDVTVAHTTYSSDQFQYMIYGVFAAQKQNYLKQSIYYFNVILIQQKLFFFALRLPNEALKVIRIINRDVSNKVVVCCHRKWNLYPFSSKQKQ